MAVADCLHSFPLKPLWWLQVPRCDRVSNFSPTVVPDLIQDREPLGGAMNQTPTTRRRKEFHYIVCAS